MVLPKKVRELVHKKYNGKCAYCGVDITYKEMQVDHAIPQSCFQGHVKNKLHIPPHLTHLGEWDCNHIDNLMPACRVCNLWKSTHSIQSFKFELEDQIKRLNERSSNYRIAKKYGLITEQKIPVVSFYFEMFT